MNHSLATRSYNVNLKKKSFCYDMAHNTFPEPRVCILDRSETRRGMWSDSV